MILLGKITTMGGGNLNHRPSVWKAAAVSHGCGSVGTAVALIPEVRGSNNGLNDGL